MLHDDIWPSIVYWHEQVGWECLQQFHTSTCCDHITHAATFSGRVVELEVNTAQQTADSNYGAMCAPTPRQIQSFLPIPAPSCAGKLPLRDHIGVQGIS